jgi:Cu/Ag efflux protein CusF
LVAERLHTHGHHPTITDLDGYPVPKEARITRDTFDIGPAQRVDLALRTGNDGFYAAGPGVWLIHDHAQPAASNKGINPGGDHTAIVYEEFMGEDGLPKSPDGHAGHEPYFNPDYYKGKVPVFDPRIFGSTIENYEKGWPTTAPAGGVFDYPVREQPASLPRLDLIDAERHRPVANSCTSKPRSNRRIVVKAGRQYARQGEVFAFEPRDLRVERCQEVEIVLENTDEIRHDLMIPGLNPIFALNVLGPNTASASFVTPDEDITLFLHCHLPLHDKVGMMGKLIVGKGSQLKVISQAVTPPKDTKSYKGIGVVIAVVPRGGRLILNHQDIPGFMAAMEMSYVVTPSSLLAGLNAGDKISFTIDAAKASIVSIDVIERAR